MATIQDRIDLADGVSPALRRMVQAAELAAARFEMAGQAAGRISRAADFAAAARDLSDVGSAAAVAVASINEIHVGASMIPLPIHTAAGAVGNMNNELRQSTGILGGIRSSLASTFAQFTLANMAANYLQQFISMLANAPGKLAAMSDQYSGIIARLNLVTGSQEQTAALNDQIYYSALRARGGYAEMADAVSKIAMTAKEAFPDARTVVPFMENVQKLFTIGGTDAVRQKDALLQLTQALGSGKLQGDEFRSIAEAAPMIERVVAEFMGVTQGALKELSSKGEITAEIMKNAILGATDEINAKFNTIPLKWQDIWQNAKTVSFRAFVPVFEQISRLANSDIMKRFSAGIVGGVQLAAVAILGLMNNIEWLAGVAGNLYTQFQAAFDGLGTALMYLVGVWAIYEGGVIAATIATAAWGLVTSGMSAVGVLGMMVMDLASLFYTLGVAETYAGLSGAAMWFAVLAPVALVIAAVYLIVAAVNHFCGTSISATGIIFGAFAWLFENVYNMVAFAWNYFVAYAEFLQNFLKDPLSAMYNMFADIWNGIVQLVGQNINTIIGLINKIPGMDVGFADWGKATLDKKYIEGGIDLSDSRMDYKSGNVFSGYNMGESIINSIANWKPSMPPMPKPNNFNSIPGVDELTNASKDTANNTKAIKDAMEITDEDIKYLRDAAEQEVINKFTTAEIKVDMGGINNNVSSNVDLDGMVRYLNDSLLDTMFATAEGVHK